MNVAVLPESATLPPTDVFPCFSVNDEVEMVAEFIASLKVTLTLLAGATEVAPEAGVTDCTVGFVTSVTVAAAVVKLQV